MMKKEEIEEIKKIVERLLKDLGVEASVEVSVTENESEQLIKVQIETPEAATLIGFHGETLQSTKTILSFLINKLLGRWVKVEVNVGDYNQKREDQLRKLALNLAIKAKFSKEVQIIPNLNSSERRLVHLILTDHPDVYTESEGEGRNRCLMIKPKVK